MKRLLRPKQIGPLLEKALPLAEPGTCIELHSDKELLISAGPTAGRNGSHDNAVSLPLELGDKALGRLVLIPPPCRTPAQTKGFDVLSAFLHHVLAETITREDARRQITSDTLDKYREIELLHTATLTLNNSLRLREVCSELIIECQKASIPAQAGIVFIRDQDNAFTPMGSYGQARRMGLKKISGSELFQDAIHRERGELIDELTDDPRWHGDAAGVRSLLVVPLMAPNLMVGALVLASSEPAAFQAAHLKRATTLASVAGISMGNAYHFEGMQSLMDALLQALATAIDARDPYTSGHSQRVANLSVELARAINEDGTHLKSVRFSPSQIHEIYYGGLLHDIGKIGVREQVLTKNARISESHMKIICMRLALYSKITGEPWEAIYQRLDQINRSHRIDTPDVTFLRELNNVEFEVGGVSEPLLTLAEVQSLSVAYGNLTREERLEIERHPDESFRILQHIPFTDNFKNLLTIIQQHHERLDGSGYPAKITGDEILMQSRILAITDIYDAVTQKRHYKPALSRDQALAILSHEAEMGKLDGRLVDVFQDNIEEIDENARKTRPAALRR